MKKIIFGIAVGVGLAVAGVAVASSVLSVGVSVQVSDFATLTRVSDASKGVTCYVLTTQNGAPSGVSCVK